MKEVRDITAVIWDIICRVGGPGSAALCVNKDFKEYKSGIFNEYCGCTGKNLHAVLIYGYSRSGTWYIKNSWGKGWGWGGLMMMKSGNTCNICYYGTEIVKYWSISLFFNDIVVSISN